MIVVDTSAIVAIWKMEPTAHIVRDRLTAEAGDQRWISAATYVEAGTVLAGAEPGNPLAVSSEFDSWLAEFSIELASFDEPQARIALEARVRFGKGFRTTAKLNLGDCFSYALAKILNAPLLYVGNDFDKTDVKSALPRRRQK